MLLFATPAEPTGSKPEVTPSKHNEIIKARIATKQDSVDAISQTGPTLVMIFGVLVCITIIGIIPGLIILGFGWWWSNTRSNEKIRLMGEIEELEAELE